MWHDDISCGVFTVDRKSFAKCLNAYRGDLPKNPLPKNEKVLFQSHVRLCFNSLATQNSIVK